MYFDGNQFMSALTIFLSVTGALILLVSPKDNDRLRSIGYGFFCGGSGGIVFFFLLQNPDVLEIAQENIAMTLIGLVIAFFSILRFVRK